MKCLVLLLFALVLSHSESLGQQDNNALEEMAFYADVMINADAPEHRIKAYGEFQPLLKSFLEQPNSFEEDIHKLKWISIQMPKDQSFRILSWQVKESESEYSKHGFIQMKDGRLFELSTKGDRYFGDNRFDEYTLQNWPGGIVYNLMPSMVNDQEYILFVYGQKDEFTKYKVADVLHFRDGVPVFGKGIFVQEKDAVRPRNPHRIILEYSSDSVAGINFNPNLNMLIFDHLIQRMGQLPNQGPTNLSDGSYEGYTFEDGEWIYKAKIFDQVNETAPRPVPVDKPKRKVRN